jgi:endonuclease-3 related protein
VEKLREELLSVNGIGPETADSIILYAAEKPIFVVDAYTKRVLTRHSLIQDKADYHTIQDFFHNNLSRDTALFNDFHAQFVAVGHHYCKPKPRCDECPLHPLLGQD